jgi:hypothetical protein
MKKIIVALTFVALSITTAACGSNADTVSKNLSKEAEKFNVVRSIVVTNDITDTVKFQIIGRCSVEGGGLGNLNALIAVCKDSDGPRGKPTYKKHFLGLADNTSFAVVQKQGINVSEYRTKIILRPKALVPDVDLVTGQ